MIMNAIVLRVDSGSLLVRDLEINQEVLVFFRDARRFSPGNRIRITFSGAITRSIPPQITATSIERIPGQTNPPRPPGPAPSETRATVLQRRRGSLLVRNMNNNQQLLVHTPHAHHFCARQRIIVRHDTILMNNPPEVHAIDITAIC